MYGSRGVNIGMFPSVMMCCVVSAAKHREIIVEKD